MEPMDPVDPMDAMDAMDAMEPMQHLLAELQGRGIRLWVDGDTLRVQGAAPDDGLRAALREHKAGLIALLSRPQAAPALVHDAAGRHQPFPLTGLQRAYWLGRDRAIELGGVATHLYLEFDCRGLDLDRLNAALVRLIERHDMLRAVLDGEGGQRVLPQVPAYRIAAADHRTSDDEAAQAAALATREALSHQVLEPCAWPLFDIRATLMPQQALRLHVSLDLLAMDGSSIQLFFAEWHALYHGRPLPAPPAIGFRDCVLDRLAERERPAGRAARRYWAQRLDTLPPAPELPLRQDLAARRAVPRFSRRSMQLAAPRWAALKQRAAQAGVSPSCLVLCAFAELLARWSRASRFTIALTTGLREGRHPDLARVLGDFTSVVLHEIDRGEAPQGLLDFAQRQQQRLAQDLQHRAHDGIEVRREWARRCGMGAQAAMPVVFSSGLGWGGAEGWNLAQFGPCVFSVSQTSQVWLDHHATELHGALVLVWDAVDAVFEPGVLDAMFEAYGLLIEALAGGHPRPVARLPPAMQARRDAARPAASPLPQQPLHAAVVQQALRRPQARAIVAAGRTLTFGDWLHEAAAVADQLLAQGLAPGELVAIVMRKGWAQAVAALGVLLARGAYVPIDADLPPRRREALLQACGATQVLVEPDASGAVPGRTRAAPGDTRAVPGDARTTPGDIAVHELRAGAAAGFSDVHALSLQSDPARAAYLIFTSGSTGEPKGVLIEHAGAANTVLAVNRLLAVGEGDAVLGVSSLGFDLSVYDLFGVPGAGGALVLPDARHAHDPVHWAALMREHRVTLWNSAPQSLRMLLDTQPAGAPLPGALRHVLSSGDFLPLDTLQRLRGHGCGARVFSLGGATEASIWSVVHEVQAVDPRWTSIPYGRALPNQTAQVLDAALRETPDHVRGRIYIGGIGLARGYLGDPQRTALRFIVHPATGERLYDTGDIGCYDDEGRILILGRDDGQVKIRGHRVELGEVEAALLRHPAVDQACVLAPAPAGGARSLAAFVQLRAGAATTPQALRAHAAELLPDYMLPPRITLLPRLPVSANGKIDRRALAEWPQQNAQDLQDVQVPRDVQSAPSPPVRSDTERLVAAAWARVIPGVALGVDDNFFDVGGDSVLATELLRELNAALPLPLQMHELFENLSIGALARWVDARGEAAAADGGRRALASAQVLAADVERGLEALDAGFGGAPGRAAERGAALDAGPRAGAADAPPPRCVLLTGATGWVGAHLLAELLRGTRAEVVCLARGGPAQSARDRVLARLRQVAPDADARWLPRVRVLAGRLDAPAFDLSPEDWADLGQRIDRIYHLAASLNLGLDYAAHRRHNVLPLLELLHLAGSTRIKPVFVLSPAAVCRRVLGGRVQVLGQARVHEGAEGLASAYAQSKWVAEQLCWAAAQRGLPVRLYRCSHALPAAGTGLAPGHDSHLIALRAAALAGVRPPGSARLHGLPVDALCRALLGDSLQRPGQSAVVHLEHPAPPAVASVLRGLREAGFGVAGEVVGGEVAGGEVAGANVVAGWPQWLRRCRDAARHLPADQAALAAVLFEPRDGVAPVELMFGAPALDPGDDAAALAGQGVPDLAVAWRCLALDWLGGAHERGPCPSTEAAPLVQA